MVQEKKHNYNVINNKLSLLLFPKINKDIKYYEKKYPSRNLPNNAIVTRYAPNTSGVAHVGFLFSAFIAKQFAKQTKGVFFLRIDDTDKKREIDKGKENIVNDLNNFEIDINEGPTYLWKEIWKYGPYIQSNRIEIYKTYAKYLISIGLAYPCFCSKEKIQNIKEIQKKQKIRFWYYKDWAICRKLSFKEIEEKIKKWLKYNIRLKSKGNINNKVILDDLIRGKIDFPENDEDIIIIKSDWLPTYHFAHVIDDHLMHTTHIIRSDSGLSSTPIHMQLFNIFNFKIPKYAHISPILKQENWIKRKLSRKKDLECTINFYHKKGIPNEVIKLYFATITNSNFENWYNQNQRKSIDEFKFSFNKISKSGIVFDLFKLQDISKNYFSKMNWIDLYNKSLNFYLKTDLYFANLLKKYKNFSIKVLDTERNIKNPKKNISCYLDIKNEISYMYDEYFFNDNNYIKDFKININNKYDSNILDLYINKYYCESDTKELWFEKLKLLANKLSYATDTKAYNQCPNKYKWSIRDICETIRFALTFKTITIDLYEIIKLLGKEKIEKRFNFFKKYTN